MGCGGSKDVGEPALEGESAESKALNEQLEQQQKEEQRIIKLLVLGTGESGKSTVFKQMKILYAVPDPPSKFLMVVRANLFGNAHAVHQGMEKLHIPYGSEEGEAAGKLIVSKPADGNVEPGEYGAILEALNTMYKDTGVDDAIERAAEYQLNDSTRYFWDRAAEILTETYMPNEQDVLRARVRTTGIVQQNFKIGESQYTMFDVGGQRNERRKWIHCFDNVTAVIFVTAISEFDQVLYEDENTNRMDEALILFDQILSRVLLAPSRPPPFHLLPRNAPAFLQRMAATRPRHAMDPPWRARRVVDPSFTKTSMILFLNKRDLFEAKLLKKDLTCWRPETEDLKRDPVKCLNYIKECFLGKNADPSKRQVYVHATCATDTSNIAFVMESVFDIILKENLRKMDTVDVDKMATASGATGASMVKFPPTFAKDTVLLCACFFVDTLKERMVLVADAGNMLPAVEVQQGKVKQDSNEWKWVMGLGKSCPNLQTAKSELGSFEGNFKDAARKLREVLGGVADLGFVYDEPIVQSATGITLICCCRSLPDPAPLNGVGLKLSWKVFEEFENAQLKQYAGVDTQANPCKPPPKGEEFNPFAANPVGHRWFKGINLYSAAVNKPIQKGVYLGIFKVYSAVDGFMVMVNEHNRIMIPLIFLTETQLNADELKWLQGVRIRWNRNIDLLEGNKPNRGWLGPEMSGEEGATFAEKLWWAIDEAKARLDVPDKEGGSFPGKLGALYDSEIMDVDENGNIQLVMFASIAKEEKDILPGHVWVDRSFLEVQNLKYMCPTVLGNILQEQNALLTQFAQANSFESNDMEAIKKNRDDKARLKEGIASLMKSQTPLKWVNRVIMWVADKTPSFSDKIAGSEDMAVEALVLKSMEANVLVNQAKKDREALIAKYKKA